MRILYYTWNENSQKDMKESLIRLGHDVVCCSTPFSGYDEDKEFCNTMQKNI